MVTSIMKKQTIRERKKNRRQTIAVWITRNSYTRQVFARRRSMIHMPSFRSCTRDARRLSYMMEL